MIDHCRIRIMACHLVLTLLFVAVVPAASAQIYKWVDEKGVTQFSAKKPATQPYKAVTPKYTKAPARTGVAAPSASASGDVAAGAGTTASGAEDCKSKLCQLVNRDDPDCASQLCGQAAEVPDDCHTIACQSKRSKIKKHLAQFKRSQETIARNKARQDAYRNGKASENDELSDAEKQRNAGLVRKCKANRGVDCESEAAVKKLVEKNSSPTAAVYAERQRLRREKMLRQQLYAN